MDKIIQTGMASYGMSGKVFHGPLLKSHGGFRLKKIVERNAEKSKADFPEAVRVHTWNEILSDPDIELAIVNTPPQYHVEMCRQALQAGKHVVVEKPFTPTADEARQLIGLARKHNRILTVFHNRRWDGGFLTIRKVLENQWLGRLVEYEANYDRYRNYLENSWKEAPTPGSGIVYNLGSHLIDQALVLFGMPQAVTAEILAQRSGGTVDDNFHILLHYAAHRVVLRSGFLVREPKPSHILNGTEGTFMKRTNDPQEEALKAGRSPLETLWGTEPETDWGTLNTQLNGLHLKGRVETVPGNYRVFYENLYQAITANAPLLVQPEEALHVIQIIEAAYQSNAEKRTVEV